MWTATSIIAKALASKEGWETSSEPGTPGNHSETNNATGFAAYPAGNYDGEYDNFGYTADFWSSTEENDDDARFQNLYYSASVSKDYVSKGYGFSVRCVRD